MWKNAWHFVGETLRDGRPIPADGEWLIHGEELIMCEKGLHASQSILDASTYAPGTTICRVRLAGEIVEGNDKMVAAKRKILWRIDGEEVLRAFARWCALQVLHLWDAPDVVLTYLLTGNENIRADARDAARDAARAAAWAAAWDAARAAARAAAWAAARDAARAAARAAAWAAAWTDARDAARAAAWDVPWAAHEKQLLKMVEEARNGKTEWIFEEE